MFCCIFYIIILIFPNYHYASKYTITMYYYSLSYLIKLVILLPSLCPAKSLIQIHIQQSTISNKVFSITNASCKSYIAYSCILIQLQLKSFHHITKFILLPYIKQMMPKFHDILSSSRANKSSISFFHCAKSF